MKLIDILFLIGTVASIFSLFIGKKIISRNNTDNSVKKNKQVIKGNNNMQVGGDSWNDFQQSKNKR